MNEPQVKMEQGRVLEESNTNLDTVTTKSISTELCKGERQTNAEPTTNTEQINSADHNNTIAEGSTNLPQQYSTENIVRKHRAGLILDNSDISDTEISSDEQQLRTLNNDEILRETRKTRKRIAFLGSDSEPEDAVNNEENIIDHSSDVIAEGSTVSPQQYSTENVLKNSNTSDNGISKDEKQLSSLNNDENLGETKKKRKRIAFLGSDSEPEDALNNEERTIDHSSNVIAEGSDVSQYSTENATNVRRHQAGLVLDDSDISDNEISKDEQQLSSLYNDENLGETKKKRKRIAFLGSDSEPEDALNNKDDIDQSSDVVYTTNSKGEIVPELQQSAEKSRLAMLCDSDSDLEENNEATESTRRAVKAPVRRKANKPKIVRDEPKRMTPKEAAEQRKEIQSESQRMLREKNLSLPYHKPKSRSLKEFLSRRPKLSRAAPVVGRAPPSIAIKMSSEQLEIISEQLREREKDVKEFYKSESESEHNGSDDDFVPPSNEEIHKESNQDVEELNNSNEDVGQAVEITNLSSSIIECSNADVEDAPSLCEEVTASTIETIERELSEHKESIPNDSQSEAPIDVNATEQTNNNMNLDPPGEISTESYDFHLEDENTEKTDDLATNNSNAKGSDFLYTDLDREIENFGDPKEVTGEAPIKSKLELLKEQLANDKPRLSGGPDEVIDLESDVGKPQEVVQLMERFAKHVAAKPHQSKHKVKLSIVTVESGGDIQQEEVAMNVDSDEERAGVEEKPGAKLHKLREELQKQMDQKKAELWQRKAAKGIRGSLELTEHDVASDKDAIDYVDEEEEAEMTDEDDEEDMDEEIENDIELTDKPPGKCAFLDEEAEVSDNEDEEECALEEECEDHVDGNKADDSDNVQESDDSNMSNKAEAKEIKKVLKRIVKPVDDDSDEGEDDSLNDSPLHESNNVQLDSTVTADEDEIPSHQPQQLQTPLRTAAASQTKSISDFLTPISFITSIQNLASASKGSAISTFRMPADLRTSKSVPQKKLFLDSEVVCAQGSLDMSQWQTQGSPSLQKTDLIGEGREVEYSEELPNTQDLLGICSGEFTGVTQLEPPENTTGLSGVVESSQCQLRSLGQEDMVISQLLDEEELENFKKKFESPVNPTTQRNATGEAEEITGGQVIDSDDELEEGQQKRKRKNQKKIQFSDDDDDDDDDESSAEDNEEIELQDDVAYDSEENEIDLNARGKSEKLKLTDFLEAEAELSESEWGSEDEDEKGLDELEFELGDTEKFDDEQVKSDLEKIHMRRMLDDDTREVKLLQELLLEDGEMHGTGRQRQFKWKNIDLNEDQAQEKENNDDDIFLDEEESEEQWRKRRHERETFLKQQQQQQTTQSMDAAEDLLCTSQLLKIGQKFLQRSASHNSQNSTPAEKSKPEAESPLKNTPFSLQNMRGSFLNRSDQVLERVAEYTKVAEGITVNSKRTTKHFLFQSVSAMEASVVSAEGRKRKAAEGTPNVLKKLRLNANLSPAVKKLDKPERSKKLFNF